MKFKENFKRFFTLDRHHDAGFTLVELIVVIAILAILAGVAVPAYTGYIKKAEEAADLQLVGALNTAFAAASLQCTIDTDKLIGTEIALDAEGKIADTEAPLAIPDDIALSAGELTGVAKVQADLNAAFLLFYGENINTAFKFYHTKLTYGPDGFKGLEPGQADTGVFGNVFDTIKEAVKDAVTNVNKSGFGEMGSAVLMDKVDSVTGLVAEMLGTNAGAELRAALMTESLDDVAAYLGFADDEDMEAEGAMSASDKLIADAYAKYPDDDEGMNNYIYGLMANYAVLEVAGSTSSKTSADMLTDLKQGISVGEIKDLLESKDAGESTDAMRKAASMYAMYTAYANTLEGEEKKAAEANLVSIGAFTGKLGDITAENSGFMNYLNNADGKGQAEKDMQGFISSMQIINEARENDEDGDAMASLLENGFDDPTLLAALQGLLGK